MRSVFEVLSAKLGIIFTVFSQCMIGLLVNLMLFLFYWKFDQGQDMLYTLNQQDWIVVVYFITLTLLSAFVWYYPRFFFNDNLVVHRNEGWKPLLYNVWQHHYPRFSDRNPIARFRKNAQMVIPRVIGLAVLLIPAFGIFRTAILHDAFEYMDDDSIALWLLFFSLAIAGFVVKPAKKAGFWTFFVIGASLAVILIPPFFIDNRHGEGYIQWLFAANFMLGAAFFAFLRARRLLKYTTVRNLTLVVERKMKTRSGFAVGLAIACLLGTLYFLFLNFFTHFNSLESPILIAHSAFLFYAMISFILGFWGKLIRVMMLGFSIMILVFFNALNVETSFHDIRTIDEKIDYQKPDLSASFDQWIGPRLDNYDGKSDIPVILVACEGGGSRAAFWTLKVLGEIDEHYKKQNIDFYTDYIYSIAGASGGLNGASFYYALKTYGCEKDFAEDGKVLFARDYLSTSLARMLGLDTWLYTFGLNLGKDRSQLQEEEWNEAFQQLNPAFDLNRDVSFFYPDANHRKPLLFFNCTHVQNGNAFINAPVKLWDEIDWAGDFDKVYREVHPNEGIAFNTCMMLNSRFPYINPGGRLEGKGQFVDAGYFDNYGASTQIGLITHLRKHIKEKYPELEDKIKFKTLLIINDPGTKIGPKPDWNGGILKTDNSSNQLFVPLTALYRHRNAHNYKLYRDLQKASDDLMIFNLVSTPILVGNDSLEPALPLSRYLSTLAIQSMEKCFEERHRDRLNEILGDKTK